MTKSTWNQRCSSSHRAAKLSGCKDIQSSWSSQDAKMVSEIWKGLHSVWEKNLQCYKNALGVWKVSFHLKGHNRSVVWCVPPAVLAGQIKLQLFISLFVSKWEPSRLPHVLPDDFYTGYWRHKMQLIISRSLL